MSLDQDDRRATMKRFVIALDEFGPVSPASELGVACPRGAARAFFRAARQALRETLSERKRRKTSIARQTVQADELAGARLA
jgi:hypothetical protein